jgi:hypothetical protein
MHVRIKLAITNLHRHVLHVLLRISYMTWNSSARPSSPRLESPRDKLFTVSFSSSSFRYLFATCSLLAQHLQATTTSSPALRRCAVGGGSTLLLHGCNFLYPSRLQPRTVLRLVSFHVLKQGNRDGEWVAKWLQPGKPDSSLPFLPFSEKSTEGRLHC